ncbi:MAG: uridine kinase, partial [Actinomycetota bacterium]|nr:uridine kinase [Actinomycetota bacterium]
MDSGGPQFTPADHRSVSTWQQPDPPHASPSRSEAIDRLARRILRLSPGRLRVAVDGRTGAGKTMFGHELGAAIRHRGRPTLRASLDDFKHP